MKIWNSATVTGGVGEKEREGERERERERVREWRKPTVTSSTGRWRDSRGADHGVLEDP